MTGQHEYDQEHELQFYVRFIKDSEISAFVTRNPAGKGRRLVRIRDFVELSREQLERYAYRKLDELKVGDKFGPKFKIERVWSALRDSDRVQQFTIDANVSNQDDATSLTEVAEIFVRVNSGGTRLSRSDLIFTLLKSRWKEARAEFQALCDVLNRTGEFQVDQDFIVRALLIFSGEAARMNVERMRDENIMSRFKDIFPRSRAALTSTFDFLTSGKGAAIRTFRLLTSGQRVDRGYNVLLPVAYYLFLRPTQEVPEAEWRSLRKFLYTAIFSRYLVVYIESHLDKLSWLLRETIGKNQQNFPIEAAEQLIKEWSPFSHVSDFFGTSHALEPLLNILHRGSVDWKTADSRNAPHRDHIFPQAKLRARLMLPDKVNHYANMRLLECIANIQKSDQDPIEAFAKIDEDILRDEYLIPPNLLRYEDYEKFLEERARLIHQRVEGFLSAG